MPNYRRARVPGASYFFTVTLANRAEHLLVDRIDALRRAFAQTRRELPFRIDAIVVLPEHLHCMWTLPPGDADFSLRWQRIKGRFTHASHAAGAARGTQIARPSRVGRSFSAPVAGPRIWQQRFWEHVLRDDHDFERHVDYIHFNPVKHGHVDHAADWPYSSLQRYIRTGLVPPDWAGDTRIDGCAGERLE